MRRTKIIATVGPASDSQEHIDALIAAGVDVFRLNFSHGTRSTQQATFTRIRDGARRTGRHVAVMQDLAGPKIRTGRLGGGDAVALVDGQRFHISTGDFDGDATRVSTSFADLARSVHARDRLLLDDGRIELRVVDSDGTDIVTDVVHGGVLGEHKGINAPGVRLAHAGPTEKDVEDLKFGLTLGVDVVAVSFVESAADMTAVRALAGERMWIVAKIERPQAVASIDEILAVSDAIMVARGDLGIEIPLEHVPRVQKDLIRQARIRGVPSIVATQVLESMRTQPRPTRAEVSDAANAVADGIDAIMLAGETAVGRYPTESVQQLSAIIADAESATPFQPRQGPVEADEHSRALCEAAVTLAERGHAAAIVAATEGGLTARQLAALRPAMPIYAATDDDSTARRLMLCWGVVPIRIDTAAADLPTQPLALVDSGVLPRGATVVLVRVHAELTRTDANFVSLLRLD